MWTRVCSTMERVKNAKNFFPKAANFRSPLSRFSYIPVWSNRRHRWESEGRRGKERERKIKAKRKTHLHIHRLLDAPPSRHVRERPFYTDTPFPELDEGTYRALSWVSIVLINSRNFLFALPVILRKKLITLQYASDGMVRKSRLSQRVQSRRNIWNNDFRSSDCIFKLKHIRVSIKSRLSLALPIARD